MKKDDDVDAEAGAESESDEDEGDGEEEDAAGSELAIHWLISRAAAIIRYERPQQKNINNTNGKKSGLQLLASITKVMSGEDLVPVASKIIMPLYNLIESESEH